MADRSVTYTIRGNITDLKAKMVAAGKSVSDFADKATAADKQAEKFRQGLETTGDAAGKLGLAAAAGLGLAAKAAVDWETAWAGVTKTTDGTAAQMAALEEELRELARTLPATHTEIAGVAEAAGQLGVSRESIAAFTKTMVDLGETTNLTADEAATAIAQMANVMGTSTEDVDNLGAALVALGNDGASTEQQIILMAQRISGAGAQIGLQESEILAVANAAASMGIEVEAGGTAISRVFTDMAKATAQGGDKLETFAEVAGVSADEFAKAFSETPAEAFRLFTEGLDRINQAGGDVFTTLDQLDLSDVRVSRALLSMAASGDLLADSLELGSRAWEENTALADEAAKRYETSAARVQIAWNNMKDAAIEFGDEVLPILASAADKAAGFAQAMGSLPDPVKSTAVQLAGVTAVLGGGLWFTSKVVSGIATTRNALDDLGDAGKRAGRLLRTGLAVGAVVEGLSLLNTAIDEVFDQDLNTTNLGRSLDALAAGRVSGEVEKVFGADLKDFATQIDLVTSAWTAHSRALHNLPLGGFGDFIAGDTADALENIDKIDQALAAMVESGQQGDASRIFSRLAKAAAEGGFEVAEVRDLFDQYGIAVDNAKDAAEGAAGPTKDVADATEDHAVAAQDVADALASQVAEQEAALDAMREARTLALEAANAEIAYQAAIDDAEQSIKDNGRTLDITTEKGRANRLALLDIAAAWNEQSDAVKNSKGAHRDAIDTFVRVATQMGMNKKEAREYARELLEIPPKAHTDVELDDAAALQSLKEYRRLLGDLPASVRTQLVVDRVRGQAIPGFSSGGYTGNVPVDAAAGIVHGREFVVNAEQTAKHRALLEAINRGAPGYREGGFVQQYRTQTSQVTNHYGGGIDYDRLAGAVLQARPLYGDAHFYSDGDYQRARQEHNTRALPDGRRPM